MLYGKVCIMIDLTDRPPEGITSAKAYAEENCHHYIRKHGLTYAKSSRGEWTESMDPVRRKIAHKFTVRVIYDEHNEKTLERESPEA